jgi:zinc protease
MIESRRAATTRRGVMSTRHRIPLVVCLAAVVAVSPWASPASAQSPESARWKNWPSLRPPRPTRAADVKFPPYEVRTLANGLRVVVVSHHEQPAVTLRLIVGTGAVNDPSGKAGLATITAALLDQGTTSRSAEQIADTIDYIGGAMATGAGTDLSFVNAVVMKDSFDLALEMVSDLVRNPAFDPQEIDRQRQQVLSALQVSYQDPDYIAGAVIDRLVYGFHPYGLPSGGTPASVSALTRDDIAGFHRAWFAPNNAILAIVGDLSAKEAFAGAERVFGSWPRQSLPEVVLPEPPPPVRRVVLVDRPGAVQTEIRIGNLAIPRKHPDYFALNLAIRILGGEGANRLQRVLRSERGLTYGASVDAQSLKRAGGIVAETDTRSEATGEALRLAVEEFWRLQREPVGAWELANAQAYLSGNFALTIETPNAIALQVLNTLFYDLDVQDLETFRERVNAITVDDIQRVARAYLRPGRLSIALVGDARAIAGQLRSVGFSELEQIPIDQLDLTAADFRRASLVPAGQP